MEASRTASACMSAFCFSSLGKRTVLSQHYYRSLPLRSSSTFLSFTSRIHTSKSFIGSKLGMIIHNNNNNHCRFKSSFAVSGMDHNHATSPLIVHQTSESFLRSVLANMEGVYLSRNPSARSILHLVNSYAGENICYDHFAYRTFGVDGHGIDSMGSFFTDFGYTPREELRFPVKKLRALWFSPPDTPIINGHGAQGPLPRIFISELLVDEMTSQSQEIIRKYTKRSGNGFKYAALASAAGSLTWGKPTYADYVQLSRESEYAAWTLVNGYALNHLTISTHQMKSQIRDIKNLNQFIEESGFKLNSEGGTLKVSPDGLLLQSSTVADSTSFHFADDVTESVPCSYIEFAERLTLPQYQNLPEKEIKECHRRDGFEVGNADKIFESTSKLQLNR